MADVNRVILIGRLTRDLGMTPEILLMFLQEMHEQISVLL